MALAATVLACGTGQGANTAADAADIALGDLPADVPVGNDATPTGDDTAGTPDVFLPPDGGAACQSVDCDDSNACSDDWCEAGKCQHKDNTAPCDDGNACTSDDACAAGACAAGPKSACDDGNMCTDDSCDTAVNACVHKPNTAACDDGAACTIGDACAKSACVAGKGKDCDDKNACTDDTCEATTGACQHTPKPGCVAALKPCTKTSECDAGVCDVSHHVCVPCVASADCGSGYKCSKQQCVGSKACTSGTDCKATQQVCDKTDGVCVDCVTANDCTTDQLCVEANCVAAPACKSDKECSGVCDTKKGVCVGCVATADCKAGTWCAGWQECVAVVCSGNACAANKSYYACKAEGSGYSAGEICVDSISCTDDKCDPAAGCTHVANDGNCTDGNGCTVDVCGSNSGCSHDAKNCDDGESCTDDSCDAATGTCKHEPKPNGPVGGACCNDGVAKDCNDGNACTGDSCVAGVGCASVPLPSAPTPTTCDDGNVCTLGDSCGGGACVAGPKGQSCDDLNACTADSCDAGKGCQHLSTTGGACEDGDACTAGTTCMAGACGMAKVCGATEACAAGVCQAPPAGMALIPAGAFKMGCVAGDTTCNPGEQPQHTVTLDAFYMDVFEVTVAQYKTCVDAGKCEVPSSCSKSYGTWGWGGKEQHPVNCVSWTRADAYCKWTDAKGRLPTEAEWEKAARGGLDGKAYPWGDQDPTCTPGQANTAVYNSGGIGCGKYSTWPVGTGSSKNGYGLYDMSGNVSEWVNDWYGGSYYGSSPASNPTGPSSGSYRVARGGSFDYAYPSSLRASYRVLFNPEYDYDSSGFRCIRSP